jgi:hypothetical protein
MRTHLEAKAMAKALRAALAAKNISLSHSECLELVSKQLGFDEWNMLSAKIALETGECEPSTTSDHVSLQPPVPVLTIASAAEAKKFYLDFLDFAADWGWPEDGQRPLYAQISRSEVSLHLNEQRPNKGTSQIFIRCTGLDALQQTLSRKAHGYALHLRATPDDRREIQITDPFGNVLRFSENNPPGKVNDDWGTK